jgi:hypothetical protein
MACVPSINPGSYSRRTLASECLIRIKADPTDPKFDLCKPADVFGDPRKKLAFFRVSSDITYEETLGDFAAQLFQHSLNIAHGNPRFR